MKSLLLLLLMLTSYLAHAQKVTGVYKRYTGTIDKKLPITADVMFADTLATGHYYYNGVGEQLSLDGAVKSQQIELEEITDTSVTGYFSGEVSDDFSTIKGTWYNASKSKALPFVLESFLPEGSVAVNNLKKHFAYEWQKNSKGESLGCTAAYTYCYVTNMKDKAVERKLNEALLNTELEGDESPGELMVMASSSMADEFDDYTDSYEETFSDSMEEENTQDVDESPYMYTWDYEQAFNVIYNENSILSVEEFNYQFSGGAHGNYGFSYQVYNLNSGEVLTLDDLFIPNAKKQLTAIAEKQLRSDRKLDNTVSLGEAGFFIEKLELTDNFYIDHGGIGFTYNPYEIASYADGPIAIFLKWEQVKLFIKPGGPLGWVFNVGK